MSRLKYLTAGESHGPQLTAIIEGMPSGLKLDVEAINQQLYRRQQGYGRGGRMKIETDKVEFVGGLRHSITLGSPLALVIKNLDWENWVNVMDPVNPLSDDLNLKEQKLAYKNNSPRPGHADLSGGIKYNHRDFRNVLERASARETAARVAVGSVMRQLLEKFGVKFYSHVVSIGSVSLPDNIEYSNLDQLMEITEASDVRCVDPITDAKMIEAIKDAKKNRDSLGGVVEVIVKGLPVGLGSYSQPEKRLDSKLGAALMAIPSVKGFEIGLGFKAAGLNGSDVHDEIFYGAGSNPLKKDYYRKTNNAGGIEGGITNGENMVFRVAAKPISTLNKPLKTIDVISHEPDEAMVERTDNCVVPALAVVAEASAALVLADLFLEKFGGDNIDELQKNYTAYLNSSF